MDRIEEKVTRTLEGKEDLDGRDDYVVVTSGYGKRFHLAELLKGLAGRRVKITVETTD